MKSEPGGAESADRKIFNVEAGLRGNHSTVTAVTDSLCRIGETPIVNMVWRASKKALFEPGDTKWPWKGEAAACFVYVGITSSRTLPTSSVGYWFPFYLVICKHLRGDVILRRRFFVFMGKFRIPVGDSFVPDAKSSDILRLWPVWARRFLRELERGKVEGAASIPESVRFPDSAGRCSRARQKRK